MADLLTEIKRISKALGIKPTRSKGQNFLITNSIYEQIVELAEINSNNTILEIGPGLGFLTAKLAEKAKRVLAVELDDKLASYLKSQIVLTGANNIEIFNEDILEFNLPEKLEKNENYKIVANLPYNISSIFLRLFLSSLRPPQVMILMLQREVAERIIAQAPKMNLLALSVQYYATASIMRLVGANNFWPEPQVESAIIKIEVKPRDLSEKQRKGDKLFFRLAKVGFSAKRKMLKNNLSTGLKIDQKIIIKALESIGINSSVRAENLNLENWRKLLAILEKFMI